MPRSYPPCSTQGVGTTFHRITIDGDTSTNDMLLMMANGEASPKALRLRGKDFPRFQEAATAVMDQLARAIVEDGEGMTKVVEICVRGAKDRSDGRAAGLSGCSFTPGEDGLVRPRPQLGQDHGGHGGSGGCL